MPVTQDFKEFRLECLADLVDFVDQEYARLLAQKRPQQRSFLEELKRMEVAAQRRPFRTRSTAQVPIELMWPAPNLELNLVICILDDSQD